MKFLSNSESDVSASQQYWDKTFKYYLENAYSVEQENLLCAKLEDSVDRMFSILKSGLGFMSW